jgi:prepilin-type N-terminal cleavage/methylation domain-containing protein/prepilin-type processing-associated H-X9-DG protein
MKDKGRDNRAFTLIELLVVITVIAMITSVLLPSLRRARMQTRTVVCQNNLRQIGIGIFMYAEDNRNHAPRAAPHELGGQTGIIPESDPWLPTVMFGGDLPAEERPLNVYLESKEVFQSPSDRGEPLWWFDSHSYHSSQAHQLYGSSYFYASGYNRSMGVFEPMGIAKFVGVDFSYENFQDKPLPLGKTVTMDFYPRPTRKVMAGSIPIHRTMSGVVAPNARAQWYKIDQLHLWANAVFLDGHVRLVQAFPYDEGYHSVSTQPSRANPYY